MAEEWIDGVEIETVPGTPNVHLSASFIASHSDSEIREYLNRLFEGMHNGNS